MPQSSTSRTSAATSHDNGVLLLLQVPRNSDKTELAAEELLADLYGLLTIPTSGVLTPVKRERISLEIAVLKRRIGFYVWVPNYLKSLVEEQIVARYPNVHINEVADYAMTPDRQYPSTLVTELIFSGPEVLPIRTFPNFETDSLAALTATLANLSEHEEAWIQLVLKPARSGWQHRSQRYIANAQRGGKSRVASLWPAVWAPAGAAQGAKPADYDQLRLSAAEAKRQKLGFEVAVRIVYRGNVQPSQARLQLRSIVASYKQFNATYLNGFTEQRMADDPFILALYRARDYNHRGLLLGNDEVATLFHLPHTSIETPFILWAGAQSVEPPASLPVVTAVYREDLSPLANTNFHGRSTMFGMPRADRARHLYIIGQTGAGKSGALELLTISDMYTPYGFAVIDPHGDYARNVLARMPPERASDVVYFNPADTEFPIAFNPLELVDPKLRLHTAAELVNVLKRLFDNWQPSMEQLLRYALLALFDYPEATLLDITRLLSDHRFRAEVLKFATDPAVRTFWQVEFAAWSELNASETITPLLNHLGAAMNNPLVRNIIGQPKSSFTMRQIIDRRKILIVNLAHGLIGDNGASLLGSLLVTSLQLAAMSRADVPADKRLPFYVYIDEFQNFATDSFAGMLSEARKYGLHLTVANQYMAQMSQSVRDAVFGNVGSMIGFRMGADDATVLTPYFAPKFTEYDLTHLHDRHFVISMTLEGEKVPAFSGVTLNLPEVNEDQSQTIIGHSRAEYCSTRDYVERLVQEHHPTLPQALSAPARDPLAELPEGLHEFESEATIKLSKL